MTKFIDKLTDIRFHGITNSEINCLLSKLESFIKNNEKAIFIIIDRFQKSKKEYSIIELSDTIVMVLGLSKTKKIILNVGYPFPIFSENRADLINDFLGNVEIKLFIRGEVLRKFQRNYLKKVFLNSFKNKKWTVIEEIKRFRKISANLLKEKKKIIYVDPYHFIGDAFTGLYFLEQFRLRSTAKNIVVLSRFSKHLNLLYKSYKKDRDTFKKICVDDSIIIMPDLIDNHFGENLELLKTVINKSTVIFILGRNLILHYQKNKIDAYHFNKKDVLLKNKNIEDYMDDCLSPFLESQSSFNPPQNNDLYKNSAAKIFINPYSSHVLKEIPVGLFLKIAYELSKNNSIKFIISRNNGMPDERDKWIDVLMLKIKDGKYKKLYGKINFIFDKNIADLCKKILKKYVVCALTADTSISHVLSKLMIPNITIYNEHFWDRESRQSLSAESPLGFCRYNLPQFAAILTGDGNSNKFLDGIKSGLQTLLSVAKVDNKKFSQKIPKNIYKFYEMVRDCIKYPAKSLNYCDHKKLYTEYLTLKEQFVCSEFAWLFNIYDPDQLISGINKDKDKNNRFLIYSSWKNLPLYKFINYFRY